ncbi:hypothetical protein [Alkalimarinus coralli]|uniref:hypothetical protein n=1 Tax=Alkalimarinus coralli TaxID=2935863 RepID=UPI00202B73AA|nr:hypothetical protein [Alkalimarinus coralli]
MSDKNNNSAKSIRNNRLKLVGLFAMVFVPMAAATSMYFGGWGIPSGSTNHGELIWPPVSIAQLNATDSQGQPLVRHFSLDEPGARPLKWDLLTTNADKDVVESKWVLMVMGADECNKPCQAALYTVRQVNIALGKEADRVTRVLASNVDLSSPSADIAGQYPLLSFANMDTASLHRFSRELPNNLTKAANEWNIWVVDPLGNVILRYEAERHGKDILKDMKRLLKLSNIG